MENERIFLRTDVVRHAQMESNVQSATHQINARLREAFENIGIIPSDEMLRDCFSGDADIVAREFHLKLQKELKSINMPSTRKIFEDAAHEGLAKFNSVRREIMDKNASETFKYISFENGTAVFTDESKKQLLEDFSVYVETPEEIELYNQHKEACEALNNMFKGYLSMNWSQLFDFEKGMFIPNPLVQYGILLNNIKNNQ